MITRTLNQIFKRIVRRYKGKNKCKGVKEKEQNMNNRRPESRETPTKKRKDRNGAAESRDNLQDAMSKWLQHGDSNKGKVKTDDKLLEVVIIETNDSYTNIGQVKQLLVRVQQEDGNKVEGWVATDVFKKMENYEEVWATFKKNFAKCKKTTLTDNQDNDSDEDDINHAAMGKKRPNGILAISLKNNMTISEDVEERIKEVEQELAMTGAKVKLMNFGIMEQNLGNTLIVSEITVNNVSEIMSNLQCYDVYPIANQRSDNSKSIYITNIPNQNLFKKEVMLKWREIILETIEEDGMAQSCYHEGKMGIQIMLKDREITKQVKERFQHGVITLPNIEAEEEEVTGIIHFPEWIDIDINYQDIIFQTPNGVDINDSEVRKNVEKRIERIYAIEEVHISMLNKEYGILKTASIKDAIDIIDNPKKGLEIWTMDFMVNFESLDEFKKQIKKEANTKSVSHNVNMGLNKAGNELNKHLLQTSKMAAKENAILKKEIGKLNNKLNKVSTSMVRLANSVQRTNGFTMCMMTSMLGMITATTEEERKKHMETTQLTIQHFAINVEQQSEEDTEEVFDEEDMNTTSDL